MAQIQEVAGKSASAEKLMDELMTGDFDPEEYDRRMAEAFGSGFYDVSCLRDFLARNRKTRSTAIVSVGNSVSLVSCCFCASWSVLAPYPVPHEGMSDNPVVWFALILSFSTSGSPCNGYIWSHSCLT